MKPIFNRRTNIAALVFFPLNFIFRMTKRNSIVVLLLTTVLLTGCFQHFFRTHTEAQVDGATIQKLMSVNKKFIIHFNNRYAQLQNLTISDDKLEADIVDVQPEQLRYMNPDTAKTNRVRLRDKPETLIEVHVYYPQDAAANQTHFSIPLSAFSRMDIYEFDKKATSLNHTLSWVGIIVTPVSAALIGAALTAAAISTMTFNCPQVCINNNGDYQFISGVYSGAVFSSLERTDYLPLPALNSADDIIHIKINNVKNEEQFMNRVQLLAVGHTANSNVLLDRHGNVFSYGKPTGPVSAIGNKRTDIKKQLAFIDNEQYSFDSEKDEAGFSSTILTFNKPADSKKTKLIIHAGNSAWSGYLYHSLAGLFGTGYKKDSSDPEEMEKWQTDHGIPLMVYVERNGKWVFTDYFTLTGNTASRDMIMELDLSEIKSDQVKIKLETVYHFWNLDFTGVDFSENDNMTSNLLDPSKAIRSDGTDQIKSLSSVDKDYTYLNANEEISFEYQPSPVIEGTKTSYFLVSTGYYHNMKKYEGAPKIATLVKFKNKNAFDDLSREKFNDIQKTLNGYAVESKQ